MGRTSSSASRQQPYQRISKDTPYWRKMVIASIDGTEVTYRETMFYTETCKDLFDKYVQDRINDPNNLSPLQ